VKKVSEVRALLLAAGLGTRLRPLTDYCPKCLMPIGEKPLLEYWLYSLHRCNISAVWVNLHHHREMVRSFLARDDFSSWVTAIVEDQLLGTAGTLRANASKFLDATTLIAHADNWCQCNLQDFLDFHYYNRPSGTVITMMTFRSSTPETCGIVEVDGRGIVTRLHEKVNRPCGNLANGAVYLFEPEVMSWIENENHINDLSTEVLPEYLGRIATWENTGIHRDIGDIRSLLAAQHDPRPSLCWDTMDDWARAFQAHPIQSILSESASVR
jgi:mannose-1-phosphate guanylyltransferase